MMDNVHKSCDSEYKALNYDVSSFLLLITFHKISNMQIKVLALVDRKYTINKIHSQ
jgi:hypothetical protein